MKKLILALVFTLMSSLSFADGHSGKIRSCWFYAFAKAIVVPRCLMAIDGRGTTIAK